jgi:hypothetical protein
MEFKARRLNPRNWTLGLGRLARSAIIYNLGKRREVSGIY